MSAPIRPGLCSVTFRPLPPETVVRLAAAEGVAAIEWGGDVHAPPGDAPAAEALRRLCAAAGIDCASYGSYARAGTEDALPAFDAALTSATAMGARNLRVWAGREAGDTASAETWERVTADLCEMADRAAARGVTVSVEYHRRTLTETAEDTRRLMRACDRPNLFSYWQPVPGRGRARWLEELPMLRPWLGDLHVFHWLPAQPRDERRPLAEGAADWRAILAAWTPAPGWPHGRTAFLEFVADGSEAAFADDMSVLRKLCTD
jgi:hypothetical protein